MATIENAKSPALVVWEQKLRLARSGMLPFREGYGAQRRYVIGEGVRQWFDKQNHAVLDKIAQLLLENSHGLEMFTDFALEEERKRQEEEQKRQEEEKQKRQEEELEAVNREITELSAHFRATLPLLKMKKEQLHKKGKQ